MTWKKVEICKEWLLERESSSLFPKKHPRLVFEREYRERVRFDAPPKLEGTKI